MRVVATLLATLLLIVQAGAADRPGAGIFTVGELWIDSGEARHRFEVEVADTESKRSLGLMFRDSVPSGTGMLFDFEHPRAIAMWMKNTYVPLDMLFIDGEGTIIRIAAETVPLSLDPIASGAPALAVLEIAGGQAESLGIAVGDTVEHPIFDRAPN